MKKRLAALLLVLAFAASSLASCVKVVRIEKEGKLTGEVTFDADSDVESIWQSKTAPELTEKAVDLNAFLTESKGDLKTLADKYEKYSVGTSGELNHVVKGTAEVVKVDQIKEADIMNVKLQGYDGPETIRLQIGSVLESSAIRDSLGFIKHGNYKDQVQWANVSQSIHMVIQKQVLNPLNISSLIGRTMEFIGCFTADGNNKLLVTPVQMTMR